MTIEEMVREMPRGWMAGIYLEEDGTWGIALTCEAGDHTVTVKGEPVRVRAAGKATCAKERCPIGRWEADQIIEPQRRTS